MSQQFVRYSQRPWDPLNNLKGRIGESFVENILCEAGYTVCRSGRESQVPRLFRTGEGEFLPDFFIWKSAGTSPDGAPIHRVLCIEVKFRSDVKDFFRPYELDKLLRAAVDWPELYLVLVTDHPGHGQSCFQLLDPKECNRDPDSPPSTIDLHEFQALGIDKAITDKYEELVRQVFSSLREKDEQRKPLSKIRNGTGAAVETRTAGEFSA